MGHGEGLNMKKEEALMSFQAMQNPSGGVEPERVIKSAESDVNLMEQMVTVPGFGIVLISEAKPEFHRPVYLRLLFHIQRADAAFNAICTDRR